MRLRRLRLCFGATNTTATPRANACLDPCPQAPAEFARDVAAQRMVAPGTGTSSSPYLQPLEEARAPSAGFGGSDSLILYEAMALCLVV